jgi:predicted SnoaL-like aldol condensation-catalyzing enzyme
MRKSQERKTTAMLVLVDPNDRRAVRNKDMILDHYDRMINNKDAETETRNFDPGYIQHNPLMADGRVPLARFFAEITPGIALRRTFWAAIFAAGTALLAPQAAHADAVKAAIVLVDPRDRHAVRNIDNVLTLYRMMVDENKAVEGTAEFLVPGYIQHNPLIADGSAALGKYFAGVKAAHPRAHVVVYRIIAVGDYVFAHVNFVNLLTDDPKDRGVAGVDIYKMNADGKAVEHWDALQRVGDSKNSAPWVAPNLPAANANGMF